MDDDDIIIPAVGDVAGLTQLYWTTVRRIRANDIPEADKVPGIAEIDQRFRAARADPRDDLPQFNLDPVRPRSKWCATDMNVFGLLIRAQSIEPVV